MEILNSQHGNLNWEIKRQDMLTEHFKMRI